MQITEYKKAYGSMIILFFLSVSCVKEVTVSPPDEPPPQGFVFIDSYPDNARIFMNDKDRVRSTPDSLRWLATGTYQFTLKKEFFLDSSFALDVIDGERSEILIDYTKNPRMLGDLSISSKPEGAAIFINDSNVVQVTPASFESLLPGRYKITLTKEGHLDKIFTTIIRSSNLTEEFKILVDSTVWKIFTKDNSGLPEGELRGLVIDDENKKWLATFNELYNFENGRWERFLAWPPIVINSIKTDLTGDILIGGDVGVYSNIRNSQPNIFLLKDLNPVGPDAIELIQGNRTIVNFDINDLASDNFGLYFFATDEGIVSIEDSTVVDIPETDNFVNKIVHYNNYLYHNYYE